LVVAAHRVFRTGQACRSNWRRERTGSGCGGTNTAMHFGHQKKKGPFSAAELKEKGLMKV
jgi:hypothetical protein